MSRRITIAVALVFAVLLTLIVRMVNGYEAPREEVRKVIVGIVLPGSVTEVGWNGDQYRSVKSVTDDLGVELMVRENVAEGTGDVERAVNQFVEAGTRLIILGSFNYPSEIDSCIKAHKDVAFYGISEGNENPNFKPFSTRAYQARFLSGVIAGLNSKTGKLGYVAAMNNSEVNRGINAFTLGARRVNPKAKVFVRWTNSWDDEVMEKRNVDVLVKDAGVDVLGYHQNRVSVLEEAESLGVMAVAFSLEKSDFSPLVLSSATANWSGVYREIIQDYLQQKKSVSNYWVGADKGAVEIQFFSSAVSDSARQVVEGLLDSLKNGMDVFAGPIYDNHRRKRCDKNEVISDLILRGEMNWFVDGVAIYEDR